ncbi:MAG: OpgC domain-containing protein [Acidimicrobiia bacterium]|nr:OpgC domain-containing protein [Acidimicrobiia bacterium]
MTTVERRETSRSGWRYRDEGRRDLRLDLLRGFALFAMAINHFGLHQSYLHSMSGRSNFLINAAEVFFFISGMTLGVIAFREPLRRSVERLLRRTAVVYFVVIGISLGFAVLALTTDLELWGTLPQVGFAGFGEWLAEIVTMRAAPFGADVLVAYVVYLGISPLALWALATGRWRALVAVVVGFYLLSQLAPQAVEIPVAAFRNLAANGPVFFGGLLIGWYRTSISERVAANPQSMRLVHIGNWVVIGVGIGLAMAYGRGFEGLPVLEGTLAEGFAVREEVMPLVPLLVVFLYLRFLWLVVDYLWLPLERALGLLLLPLGQASLFTYTAHLVVMPLFWNLPWFVEDVSRWAATLWVSAYVAVIYGAVRLRSFVRAKTLTSDTRRARLRRMPEAIVTGLLVLAVSTAALVADDRAAASAAEHAEARHEVEALIDHLEAQNVEYEVWEEDDWIEVEIDWKDPAAVEVVERFWEEWDPAEAGSEH